MIKKRFTLLVLFGIALLMVSCNDKGAGKEIVSYNNENNNNRYYDLIYSYLVNKYSKIDNLEIIDAKSQSNDHIFTQFLLTVNEMQHEGIAYIYNENEKYQIFMEEDTLIDSEAEITKLMLVGELRNSDQKYKIVSGIVHNKSIEKLLIKYKDNNNVIMQLNDEKRNYLDVRVIPSDSSVEVENIYGLDHNDKEIFKLIR